ncbi:hypothetical protein [Desulfotignum balticum]|jgi:hypothetical protein|nr:hypothetical protein [Desulfotignum balticum]
MMEKDTISFLVERALARGIDVEEKLRDLIYGKLAVMEQEVNDG